MFLSVKFYLDKVILFAYCLWLVHATIVEMSYRGLHNLKYLLSGPLQRVCCTCLISLVRKQLYQVEAQSRLVLAVFCFLFAQNGQCVWNSGPLRTAVHTRGY